MFPCKMRNGLSIGDRAQHQMDACFGKSRTAIPVSRGQWFQKVPDRDFAKSRTVCAVGHWVRRFGMNVPASGAWRDHAETEATETSGREGHQIDIAADS
ncbi:hypothetical protein GCM10017612_34700 [Novosphingobium resinovorum]|nr:hypothetical protein GCM10017612_34700 [Novosphingobium resinovorum]